jgi:hypothetical protein
LRVSCRRNVEPKMGKRFRADLVNREYDMAKDAAVEVEVHG